MCMRKAIQKNIILTALKKFIDVSFLNKEITFSQNDISNAIIKVIKVDYGTKKVILHYDVVKSGKLKNDNGDEEEFELNYHEWEEMQCDFDVYWYIKGRVETYFKRLPVDVDTELNRFQGFYPSEYKENNA